jgi:hypothetical protein
MFNRNALKLSRVSPITSSRRTKHPNRVRAMPVYNKKDSKHQRQRAAPAVASKYNIFALRNIFLNEAKNDWTTVLYRI